MSTPKYPVNFVVAGVDATGVAVNVTIAADDKGKLTVLNVQQFPPTPPPASP